MEKHPPLLFDVVAIEKGAFRSPLTMVGNFTHEWVKHGIATEPESKR